MEENENLEKSNFNDMLREKTKQLAVRVVKMYAALPKSDEIIIIGKQLMRSATSTAANFRAACRGRSHREFRAKLSIAVEEADETVFWLEMLRDTGLLAAERLANLEEEALSVLKIVAKMRKNAYKNVKLTRN